MSFLKKGISLKMLLRKLRGTLLLLSLLSFTNSTSASAADPIECMEVLKDVWYNTYHITDKETTYNEMRTVLDWTFEDLNTEIQRKRSSSGGSLSIPLPVLESVFNLGASAYSGNDSNWERNHRVKEAYYSSAESRNLNDVLKVVFMRTASREAVEAYRECVQSNEPLRVRTGGDLLSDFQLIVSWTQRPGSSPSIEVDKVHLTGAKFAEPQTFPQTVSSGTAKAFSIIRTSPNTRGFVTVSTTGGTRYIDLPVPPGRPPVVTTTTTVDVSSTATSPSSSGIRVRRGSTVSVQVNSGSWTISKPGYGSYPYTNGIGMPWEQFKARDPQWARYTWPMPGANPGALIAQIGSIKTQVGSGKSWTATEDGELVLLINDATQGPGMSDNDGILNVTNTVTTPAETTGIM